jgi:hypothetical protein
MRIVTIAYAGRLSRCILDLTTTAFPPTPHYAPKDILWYYLHHEEGLKVN